jgi:hypothetical protein
MKRSTHTTPPTRGHSIHLQGVGRVSGILAKDLQVHMRLMWNYGSTFEVIKITDKSAMFLEVIERSTEGKDYTRRLKKDRVVAGYWPRTV